MISWLTGNGHRDRFAVFFTLWVVTFGLWTTQVHAQANGQPDGEIRGTVSDATGAFNFADAEVVLEGQRRTAVTDRSGRFRFANVSAGDYTLITNYAGAPPERLDLTISAGESTRVKIRMGGSDSVQDGTTQLDGLLVEGAAAGQAAAINRRQRDETIIDVLSSDSVGNFPDQNVAEALQRVPGISVQRDQGEGRFVVIRGIDPSLNSTTVNGQRIPGPESDSRAVNLDIIASDLVESVEINKAITPDMDGDAVGGNIEIKTLTAFDLGGRSFSLTAGGSYNDARGETSPDLSATYTDLFSIAEGQDNLGVAVAVSQFDRDLVSDGIEGCCWPLTESPQGGEFRALEEGEQRDYVLTRKRTSAAVNFDFRPTEDDEYYLRTLYSEFDDAETKLENVYKFADGNLTQLDEDSAAFEDAEFEKKTSDSNKIAEVASIVIGGENDLAPWTIDYNAGYSQAGEKGDQEVAGEFLAEGVDMSYDKSGDAQQPILSAGPNGLDPTAFALQETEDEDVFTEEREFSVAFNARRDVEFGYVKFGAKSRLREKENDIDINIYDGFDDDYTIEDVQGPAVDFPPRGNYGPAIDPARFTEFHKANRANWDLNEEDSAIDSRGEDYELEEDIHAAYFMAGGDVNDRLFLMGGLRVEHTKYSAVGTQVSLDEQTSSGDPVFEDFSGGKSYTNFFPGLHARFKLSDNMNLRAAATRTIARPGFEAASPRQVIEISDEGGGEFERVAEIGNPDLDPLKSNNLDVRWEYFPNGISVISAGAFYKDISDYFLSTNTAGQAPFENFDEVSQTINGGDATLFGMELGYTRQLAFLPSPFDGLLVDANYTFTDSEASIPERDSKISLPSQSDHIANLSVGYEKYGFSIRVAGTYRSEFFEETEDPSDPAFDRYQDDHVQLDVTSKYRINDHVQVFANAINLNDEPLYAYFGDPDYNSQYEEYGPSYEAGVRLDF
jgi:TonB-dependent receptor